MLDSIQIAFDVESQGEYKVLLNGNECSGTKVIPIEVLPTHKLNTLEFCGDVVVNKLVLDNIDTQISKDHQNAKVLAEGIESIKGLKIDSNKVKSNILYCRLDTDVIGEDEFLNLCKKENILFFKYPSGDYRLVTHSGINEDDIKLTLSTFEKILS